MLGIQHQGHGLAGEERPVGQRQDMDQGRQDVARADQLLGVGFSTPGIALVLVVLDTHGNRISLERVWVGSVPRERRWRQRPRQGGEATDGERQAVTACCEKPLAVQKGPRPAARQVLYARPGSELVSDTAGAHTD